MRVVSDKRLVEAVSPNEEVRTLLTNAVAEFREKYLGLREIKLEQGYYHSELRADHWRLRDLC